MVGQEGLQVASPVPDVLGIVQGRLVADGGFASAHVADAVGNANRPGGCGCAVFLVFCWEGEALSSETWP